MPIRAVIFDVGGVILTSPFDSFARYEADNDLPAGLLRQLNATNPDTNAWARLERSEVDLAGFAEDAMASGGRGQVLMPWPNRIRDGRYTFAGTEYQLPISEPARHNASHGLVRWVTWQRLAGDGSSVLLGYRLPAQTGYPWTLDLEIAYSVGADGLTVALAADELFGNNSLTGVAGFPFSPDDLFRTAVDPGLTLP